MDLFDLYVKIGADTKGFDDSLDKTLQKLTTWTGLAQAAIELIGSTMNQAIGNYSRYEQLIGGAEKIFGNAGQAYRDAFLSGDTSQWRENNEVFNRIAEDAKTAYKTMQLSANDYIDTIVNVGAAFKSNMSSGEAYDLAKRGMQMVSDYATGVGKDVDLLATKFRGLAKGGGSFQSMADNFPGMLPQTSAAFLEQAQAVGLLSTEYGKLTQVPLEEYQRALVGMMEIGTEKLKLSGNTEEEASTTIEGSVGQLKAAWETLTTAMADENGDVEGAAANVAEAMSDVVVNYVPVIFEALGGALEGLWGVLEESLGKTWDELTKWVKGKWEELKEVFSDAADIGGKIVDGIIQGISNAWSKLTGWLTEKWNSLVSAFTFSPTINTPGGSTVGENGHGGHGGTFASGLDYVPYNGYPATLHRGEAVLTAGEAAVWRSGGGQRNVTVNIYPQSMSAAEQDRMVHMINTRLGALA